MCYTIEGENPLLVLGIENVSTFNFLILLIAVLNCTKRSAQLWYEE